MEFVKSGFLESVRKRHQERVESGLVGGVREWFDIAFLLSYIDKLEEKRWVSSEEQLDDLPHDTLVLTEQGGYWVSIKRQDGKNWWVEPGAKSVHGSEDLTLPAEVVRLGE